MKGVRKYLVMPYQMLKYLTTVSGPTVLTEPDDIERVLLLRAAQLVEADIPPFVYLEDGHTRYAGAAVIHRVTAVGRKLACRRSSGV
jgi:hypothetical protein